MVGYKRSKIVTNFVTSRYKQFENDKQQDQASLLLRLTCSGGIQLDLSNRLTKFY